LIVEVLIVEVLIAEVLIAEVLIAGVSQNPSPFGRGAASKPKAIEAG
jgi:hypothetical protein